MSTKIYLGTKASVFQKEIQKVCDKLTKLSKHGLFISYYAYNGTGVVQVSHIPDRSKNQEAATRVINHYLTLALKQSQEGLLEDFENPEYLPKVHPDFYLGEDTGPKIAS
jgi:hypothetical protein